MKKERGFSLLEVLVTLVVVSLGLLGVAALIANSMKYNQSSYARTQATWLANQIIDEMRANRITAAPASPAVSPYAIANGATVPTGTSVPQTDLREWLTTITSSLPTGQGSISYNSATGEFTVIVSWDDSSRMSGNAVVSGSGAVEVQTRL